MGLGIKRRVLNWLVKRIRAHKGVLRELASTKEMKEQIVTNPAALREIVQDMHAHPFIEERAFFWERFYAVLGKEDLPEDAYDRMIQILVEAADTPEQFHRSADALLHLFEKLLQEPHSRNTLLNSEALLATTTGDASFREAILKTPEVEQAAAKSCAVWKRALAVPGFTEAALEDENFRARIARNEALQQEILRIAIKNSLWQLGFAEILEAILRDSRLFTIVFGDPGLTGRLSQEVAKSEAACHKLAQQPALRMETLAQLVRGPLWQDEYTSLVSKLLADQKSVDIILKDDALLERILSSDPAIVKTATLPPVRWKMQLLRARERAACLPYLLPAVVLSYPRAGSNFLQSVLQGSSGLRCQSIYSPFREDPNITLSVKSHSPSPAYFEDEWHRLLPDRPLPAKILRLQRDPRDVLISFLEYTEANRKTAIRQEEFLNNVDYFYASTVDRDFLRSLYKQGMTVAEAFKEHVRTWYVETPPDYCEILPVRYEDLVLEPRETFTKIFDFLNLDCELAEKFLRVKVSLYSDTGRPRAQIQGWRKNLERYGTLLQMVHEELAEEIRCLGYEEADASDTSETP